MWFWSRAFDVRETGQNARCPMSSSQSCLVLAYTTQQYQVQSITLRTALYRASRIKITLTGKVGRASFRFIGCKTDHPNTPSQVPLSRLRTPFLALITPRVFRPPSAKMPCSQPHFKRARHHVAASRQSACLAQRARAAESPGPHPFQQSADTEEVAVSERPVHHA